MNAETRYLETSTLLAAVLEGAPGAMAALAAPGRLVASMVTFAEAARVVARSGAAGRLGPASTRRALGSLQLLRRRCCLYPVTAEILESLGRRFPHEPVRTLDAIHLVTLQMLGEPPDRITVLTRDHRMRDNAEALGFRVV
ncbi:MAG: PIN domain-containing protein [Terriglobales bacterium]